MRRGIPLVPGGSADQTHALAVIHDPQPSDRLVGGDPERHAPLGKASHLDPLLTSRCAIQYGNYFRIIDIIAVCFLLLKAHRHWQRGQRRSHTPNDSRRETLVSAHFGHTSRRRPGGETGTGGPAPPGALDGALLGGPPQRVGTFEYRYDTDTWTWSDTVAKMHGYEPGEVQPTTELVLSHKHPEDLARVKALLKKSSAPFSSRHRIRTTTGQTRKIVVVGDAVTDPSGRTVATQGFYVDVTEAFHADLQQEVGDELQVIVAHREVIEQAKGMLMAIYELDAQSAFGIMTRLPNTSTSNFTTSPPS